MIRFAPDAVSDIERVRQCGNEQAGPAILHGPTKRPASGNLPSNPAC